MTMARSDRLFRLLHALRTLPQPVTADRLAAETGVSPRTLYRDIQALRAAGALIDGEAGYGYSLTEDVAMPPQSFDRFEIEALVLGLAEVSVRGDKVLAKAAESALAKIRATLPERQQQQVLHAVTQVYRFRSPKTADYDLTPIVEASWEEEALDIAYTDGNGRTSERRIFPLSTVYVDDDVVVLAWCCMRQDFRQFLPRRMTRISRAGESFRPRRVTLLRQYIKYLQSGRSGTPAA